MVHPKVLANCGIDPARVAGLRLRHGDRAHRHAEVRHPRPAHRSTRATCAGCAITASPPLDVRHRWMRGLRDEVHALLAARPSRDRRASSTRSRDTLTMHRPRGRRRRGSRRGPGAVPRRPCGRGRPHPERRPAARLPRRYRQRRSSQVVCGAPNARTGMKGVFAPPGSVIPGTGITLKVGEIRGVEVAGMLLLGARDGPRRGSRRHRRTAGRCAGRRAVRRMALGLDDPVIDVAVTPNRGDCLGVRGIARDLAAAGLGRAEAVRRRRRSPGGFDSPIGVALRLPADGREACPLGRRPPHPRREERAEARTGCRIG